MSDATLLRSSRPSLSRPLTCLSLALACLLTGCQTASFGDDTGRAAGQTYYTQFSLFQEKNRHLTTNYRRGILVPINTKVTLLSQSRDTITVRDEAGNVLNIVNVPNFSGENINGIFQRTLGAAPFDLSAFSELEQRNIKNGTVALGMSKDAVVRALGYPPKHQTPSLESNQWRYWAHRLGTFIVSFADGKVSEVNPPQFMENAAL